MCGHCVFQCDKERAASPRHQYVALGSKDQLVHIIEVSNEIRALLGGLVVMSRGNPWVQQAIPIPIPPKTPTPHQGYGFLKGLNIHTPTPHTLD